MKKKFRNVYGTLMFADDTTSSIIVPGFMTNKRDMPAAQALRKAQLDYLQNPPKLDYSNYPRHPYYWAFGNIFGQ
jgi:CHAT domain-containing protein